MEETRVKFEEAEAQQFNNPFAKGVQIGRKRRSHHRDGKQRPFIVIRNGCTYRFMFGERASLAITSKGFNYPKATLHRDAVTGALFVVVGEDEGFTYTVHNNNAGTGASYDSKGAILGIVGDLGLYPDENGRYHFAISGDVSKRPEWCVFLISRP